MGVRREAISDFGRARVASRGLAARGRWIVATSLLLLAWVLTCVLPTEVPAAAKAHKPGYYPDACNPVSTDPAVRSFPPGDAWRFSRAYAFPFNGWTPHGRAPVTWKAIPGATKGRTAYPKPNLPSCRVGRFGTEDRATNKGGRFFPMLEPVDGQTTYVLRDTFDRPVAKLSWFATPPVKYHPSKWGWFVNGSWAGHDAARAFEIQSNACKLIAAPVTTTGADGQPVTEYHWVRDPNYVTIAFNPALRSPGKGYAPRSTFRLRVRAFIDRRAVPPEDLAYADRYDFGCGETPLQSMLRKQTYRAVSFASGYGPHKRDMYGYYFGELPTRFGMRPGEAPVSNHHPLNNYNPRPQFHNASYAMINTTGVAAGGMVRGIVRSGVDRFTMFDEMRYCDPNYTLRNMRLRRGKRKIKKSHFFARSTFSRRNRPAVRWVFGRIDPAPLTLTAEQAAADHNPASQRLFAWLPLRCDR